MGVFGIGNLITIGAVILALILFRLMDRSNRSLDKVRKYADRCKDEITAFVAEKGAVIKDYGIALEVERKSAAELMRRIQNLTREELAQKVQALAQIDDRIRDYDTSLEELVQMTGRVQENLNRVRDESSFVENVGKRVGDVKEKLEKIEEEIASTQKNVKTIEQAFERENAESLEKIVEDAMASARSAILDMEASAQNIERKVDGHRDAINKLEKGREEKLARDEERIEKLLAEAIDKAGNQADKVEEAALAKLRDQAQERLSHAKENFEEKIQSVQDSTKAKLAEIQEQLKGSREEWKAEGAAAEQKLEEYRQAHEEQYRQLSGVTGDIAKLEAELRISMRDATERVNNDFAGFIREIHDNWENSLGEFNGKLEASREELAGVDRELTGLKEKAFENVSKKLNGFEDDFLASLSERSANIDIQLAAWEEAFEKRMELSAAEADKSRQKAEHRITDDIKKTIAAQGEKIISDLERLKAETVAFEEGIREEMRGADESKKSFSEQLANDLEEAKSTAENELKTQISQYSLSVSEVLRQSQRELETQIRDLASDTRSRIDDLESSSENFRRTTEEWQAQYNSHMREFEESVEEARRRSRELLSENDERIASARASMDEIRKGIAVQTKQFERTDALKAELDRHVEDMGSNIERLAQLKNEIARFDSQFTQIKRLEDDVNAKMTRFLSEKHRIEVMENDFNRLLQTSQSVEERLAQVSNSDDVLQTMQVQIRRLEDVIKDTEEKYQRVERKSKTLQETNDGIDRNFRVLQEGEQSVDRLEDSISLLKADVESIQRSVEALSAENEKARDAAEKLSTLDESVKWLEKRIAEMNVAREGLGRLATELQNLDKDAQTQLKLTRSLLDREAGKTAGLAGKAADEGAPPPRDRENIIRLKRQGWSIDEIARSMKISKGEVELILELGPKET